VGANRPINRDQISAVGSLLNKVAKTHMIENPLPALPVNRGEA
jgi:hypothetical protein